MKYINEFFRKIELYKNLSEGIKSGCTSSLLDNFQVKINKKIPKDFMTLYSRVNGEVDTSEGVFKVASGYNKYCRMKFLPLSKVIEKYRELLENEYIDSIFNEDLLPFATDKREIDDVFCYDLSTGKIYLLWTLIMIHLIRLTGKFINKNMQQT